MQRKGRFNFAKLSVTDIFGKEVVLLVNETKAYGSYIFAFDASSLPSGI